VLPKYRKIIFVHGCFWHGHENCKRSKRPTTNAEFWDRKISANIQRDKAIIADLCELGWSTLIIWQCEIKDQEKINKLLKDYLISGGQNK
jgi:DNA mismatch endonuclease (patch repair protein)